MASKEHSYPWWPNSTLGMSVVILLSLLMIMLAPAAITSVFSANISYAQLSGSSNTPPAPLTAAILPDML
jgi:hypothetical protein